jgi:hypothetical protein
MRRDVKWRSNSGERDLRVKRGRRSTRYRSAEGGRRPSTAWEEEEDHTPHTTQTPRAPKVPS